MEERRRNGQMERKDGRWKREEGRRKKEDYVKLLIGTKAEVGSELP